MSIGRRKFTPAGSPHAHLVEAMISSYEDWLEECARVRQCYSRWTDAPRTDRAVAFAAYSSALDREERAADAYRQVITNLGTAAGDLGLQSTR